MWGRARPRYTPNAMWQVSNGQEWGRSRGDHGLHLMNEGCEGTCVSKLSLGYPVQTTCFNMCPPVYAVAVST